MPNDADRNHAADGLQLTRSGRGGFNDVQSLYDHNEPDGVYRGYPLACAGCSACPRGYVDLRCERKIASRENRTALPWVPVLAARCVGTPTRRYSCEPEHLWRLLSVTQEIENGGVEALRLLNLRKMTTIVE